MGHQMYFYYLAWLFVYNQNKGGYLQLTTLQFIRQNGKIGYL